MTSRPKQNRLLLAGLIALAVLTAVIAFLVAGGEEPGEESTSPNHASSTKQKTRVPLEPWPLDHAQKVRVSVDDDKGPIWQRGDESVVLSPQSDELRFESWATEAQDDRTHIVGRGALGDAEVYARWTFIDGNPQAHLAFDIVGIPSTRLASAIEFSQQPLPDERMVLWQPAAGIECHQSGGSTSFDLHTRQIIALQDATSVWRWQYANGASAQLVPVFDVPGRHSDPQIAQTAASSASTWLRRARTLIYGHSNPKDPRYGNGGLLGHGLGGTIGVPAKWAKHPEVLALAQDLAGSRVELAPRGEAEDWTPKSTRFAIEPRCPTLVDLSKQGVPAAIVGTADAPPAREVSAGELSTSVAPLLATAAPRQLDGQLSSLLSHGLDTDTLDELVRRRERSVFSTPFVATRNPLIGAASENLIEPERDGQWRVAADLSDALANLELWREATPLLVTSVGAAASWASASQEVLHWWTADGKLRVYSPHPQTLAGYTLALNGSVGAKLDQRTLSSRQILLDDQRRATLLWWDLEPGTHTLELSAENEELTVPPAVEWDIAQP